MPLHESSTPVIIRNVKVYTKEKAKQNLVPYEPMRGWFDAAHNEIIKLFSDLVSDEIQDNLWGRRLC